MEQLDAEAHSLDVVLLPPDKDDLTDEDSNDEDEVLPKDLNHLGRGVLSQNAELVIYDDEDSPVIPLLPVVNDDDPQPGPSGLQQQAAKVQKSKRLRLQVRDNDENDGDDDDEDEDILGPGEPEKLTRIKNANRGWQAIKPNIFGSSVPTFVKQDHKDLSDAKIPYDFFILFMTDEFVNKVVKVSRKYAIRKDRPDVQAKITNNSIRLSQAIMYISGYSCPSNRRMFWENREDAMNVLVKKTMSRNLFIDLIR